VQLRCRNFTGPYATLSHRWGDKQPIKLEASTLEIFQDGLKLSNLPKTFRECVMVTQQLGIRYLWIDSLCIIQPVEGDSSDWDAESATMGDVYQHSTINIAATAAKDCEDGLFRERDPADILEETIELAESWCPDVKGGKYTLNNSNLWKDELESSPLLQRGWVFQERILAKRMLHFGQSQICWECGELRASETFPNGRVNNARDVDENLKTMLTRLEHYKKTTDFIDQGYYHRVWMHTVSEYSRCKTAEEKDKLVALSGLASKIAAFLYRLDTYHAGHWLQSLPHSLLWFRIVPASSRIKAARRTDTFRAPSWSWASMDGQIQSHPDFYSGHDLVEIIEASTTPANQFGQVKESRILLFGCFARALATLEVQTRLGHRLHIQFIGWDEDPNSYRAHDFKAASFYPDSSEYSVQPSVVTCLPLRLFFAGPDKEPFIAGITVEEIPGTKRYRRTGLFTNAEGTIVGNGYGKPITLE
jgi:hypothetical protein